MWLVAFLIVMFSLKAYVTYLIIKELFKQGPKEEPKRAFGTVRAKFNNVGEVKSFQEWRDYIRVTLIEIEQTNILRDQETKVYYSL